MCSFSLTGEFLSVLFMEWPLNGTRCIHSRQSVNDDGMNERKPSISLPELAVDSVTSSSGVFYCVTSLATLETLSLFKIVDNLVVPKCCAIGDFI